MPEESPKAYQNTKLLLVAVVLGVLFVILFNFQRWREERKRLDNRVGFVLIKSSLRAGQRLTDENVTEVMFSGENAERLVGLRKYRDIDLGQTTLSHAVKANSLLRLEDTGELTGEASELYGDLIRGWRQVSIVVDPKSVPGASVRFGSRVDLHGMFPTSSGSLTGSQLVLEYVKVLKVDGKENIDRGKGGSFSKMTIELPPDLVNPIKDVEVAVKKFTVVARRPGDNSITNGNEHPKYHRARPAGGVPMTVATLAKPVREWLAH